MKCGKFTDESGVIAEMLKSSGGTFRNAVLDLFNDVIKPGAELPETWTRTRLVLTF